MNREEERLHINVADLRRRLGQQHEIEVDLVLPPLEVLASRTTTTPVTGTLVLESIERGISVNGSVTLEWQSECRRCLDIIVGTDVVAIQEIFQIGADPDDELIPFDGDAVPLYPIVRDAALLSLPLSPLCRTDCAGPDPDRYPALMEEQIADPGPGLEALGGEGGLVDPRWAALSELKLDD